MVTKKNLDLELLRAVAILMTVIQHAEVLVFWPDSMHERVRQSLGLWTGVDLFFCISGFIITRTLLRSLEKQPDGSRKRVAVAFWIKRMWRLWPIAWVWLLISVVCAYVFNASGIFGDPRRMVSDALAGFLHVANIRWAGCYSGWLETCNLVDSARIDLLFPTGWSLVVYWSLSLEEQFYLVAPLLMLFLPRRVLLPSLLVLWFCMVPLSRSPLSVLWFFRLDALIVGVLIAYSQTGTSWVRVGDDRRRHGRAARRMIFGVLCGAALVSMAWVGAPGRADIAGAISLISLFGGVMVWIAGKDERLLMPDGLVGRALTWLGARSYSMYLVHMPVYFAIREVWFRQQWPVVDHLVLYFTSASFAVVLFSELSYRLVEQPARRHGYRLARKYAGSER